MAKEYVYTYAVDSDVLAHTSCCIAHSELDLQSKIPAQKPMSHAYRRAPAEIRLTCLHVARHALIDEHTVTGPPLGQVVAERLLMHETIDARVDATTCGRVRVGETYSSGGATWIHLCIYSVYT